MTRLYLIKEDCFICEMPTYGAPNAKEALISKILAKLNMWYWVKRYAFLNTYKLTEFTIH